jgi:hypothetical protein
LGSAGRKNYKHNAPTERSDYTLHTIIISPNKPFHVSNTCHVQGGMIHI